MMHSICAFLRGDVYCGGKHTDVAQGEERPIMHVTRTQIRKSEDGELTQHYTRNWFPSKTVLEIGDPSRNVIEMIFIATTGTTSYSINIKQVIKLNNSRETLERFERFLEEVKKRNGHKNNHVSWMVVLMLVSVRYARFLEGCSYAHFLDGCSYPRNMVDGNEQLLFYGTKLTCCKKSGTSKLCRDSNCNICSIIKSGFYTANKKLGIWLTTKCQDFINANAEMMNAKMAIMVCRVIVGRVIDKIDSNNEGDYDSIGGVQPN